MSSLIFPFSLHFFISYLRFFFSSFCFYKNTCPITNNACIRTVHFSSRVLLLIHYATIKNDFGLFIDEKLNNHFYMLKNYFKTAWRNLKASKFYSIVNISGLAVGLATGIMLLLW